MPITLYRADSRAPEAIAEAEGFGGRKPLSLDQARSIAARFFDGNAAVDLPDRGAPGLTVALAARPGQTLTLGDMVRVAKAEKSGDTVHISTDLTQACGGYANGSDGSSRPYLTYRIDVPTNPFHIYKQNMNGSMPAQPTATAQTFDATIVGAVRPALVMDHQDPRQATMIAIVSSGDEVTFLTKVPQDWVTQYRTQDRTQPSGFSAWQDMPAHVQQQAQQQAPQQVVPPVVAPPQAQAQQQAAPQAVPPVVAPPQAQAPQQAPPQVVPPVVVPPQAQAPQQAPPQVVPPVAVPPQAQAQQQAPPQVAPIAAPGAHPYQSPDHPYNRLLTQAVAGVTALGEGNPYNRSEQIRLDTAVSLVHAARRGQIDSIDNVTYIHDGQRLFAVQGDVHSDAANRSFVQRQDIQKPAVGAETAAQDLAPRQESQAQAIGHGR